MTDLIQKRTLSKPIQLVNASKDGGGILSRFCPLRSYYVMIRDTDALASPADEELPSIEAPMVPMGEGQMPEVIQSFVIDLCSNERLAMFDVFFTLTSEFSLLVAAKVGKSAFAFNEVVDSFYLEEEVNQSLVDAPTHMEMITDPNLLIISTMRKIVIVTLDIDSIIGEIQSAEAEMNQQSVHSLASEDEEMLLDLALSRNCISGVRIVDTSLLDYIFMDDVHVYHPTLGHHISSIHEPYVSDCAVWSSSADNEGSQANLTLVMRGNGNWLRFLPLVFVEESNCWEEVLLNEREPGQPSPSVLTTSHEVWVSALCKDAGPSTLFVSGDGTGTLVVWGAYTGPEGYPLFKEDLVVSQVCGGEGIVSIVQGPSRKKSTDLYLGDESGAVTGVCVTPKGIVEQLWRLNAFSRQSAPSVLRWKPPAAGGGGSNQHSHDDDLKLHVISATLGISCEFMVQRNVALYFNAAGGIDPTRQHQSIVETCAVLIELDLLVTAGSGNYACLWNLTTGVMAHRIELQEFHVTSIATYDSGYVAGGDGRILFGFASGTIMDYLVKAPKEDSRVILGSDNQALPVNNNQGGSGDPREMEAGEGSMYREGARVTSVDIFETLEGEEDEAKGQSLPRVKSASVEPKERSQASSSSSVAVGDVPASAPLRVELQNSTSYCPLPVTDIMVSSLGLYFAFVYAKQQIVVHEWETHKAVHQVGLDDGLVDISVVPCGEPEDMEADFLVLGLQGNRSVKLLDAINGTLVAEHVLRMPASCDPQDMPQMSRLWCSGPPVEANPNSQSVEVHGVCSRHDMSHFAYSHNNELFPLVLPLEDETTAFNESKTEASSPLRADVTARSPETSPFRDLDGLLLGGCGLSDFACPLASVWTLRHSLLFRFQDGMFSRVVDFEVVDDKTRVVGTLALKLLPSVRANRAVIVLSDGSVFLLEV